MGNNQTKTGKQELKLPQVIDYLASNYITKQNFTDMKNLENKQYCDNLVILTSRVIASELNDMEIEYLSQRTQQGATINEMKKGKVIYFPKSRLETFDTQVPLHKKRLCIGIAKFYVRIAHIFAAISKTVNKQYSNKGMLGVQTSENKADLSSGTQPTISRVGLCTRRLHALLGDNVSLDIFDTGGPVTISNKLCQMNTDSSRTKTLADEPGIPELKELYYDVYDYDTAQFTKMSEG